MLALFWFLWMTGLGCILVYTKRIVEHEVLRVFAKMIFFLIFSYILVTVLDYKTTLLFIKNIPHMGLSCQWNYFVEFKESFANTWPTIFKASLTFLVPLFAGMFCYANDIISPSKGWDRMTFAVPYALFVVIPFVTILLFEKTDLVKYEEFCGVHVHLVEGIQICTLKGGGRKVLVQNGVVGYGTSSYVNLYSDEVELCESITPALK